MNELRENLDRHIQQYSHACSQVKEEKLALRKSRAYVDHLSQAQAVVQAVAEEIQNRVHQQIASVVSKCLRTVFEDEAYQFQINFRKARGRTEAQLVFVRDGAEMDPMDATGGGVVDVASLALRVAALVLSQPRKRLFLALDEPLKHLSVEYRPAVRTMLERLAKDLKIQILLITHSDEFRIGKVVEL